MDTWCPTHEFYCTLFTGPTYYPLYPVSTVEDPLEATPSHVIPSPMAPLEPPWPLLPPLETRAKKKKGGGGGGGGSLNASLNSVNFRHFLAAQEKAFFLLKMYAVRKTSK
jgi:hypothetical protein